MKICFLCSEFPPAPHGGIGRFVRGLGAELSTRGHEIFVLGTYKPPFDSPRQEIVDGMRVVRLPMPRGPLAGMVKHIALYLRARKLISEEGVELLEVPDWQGDTALWPRLDVPIVARIHGGHGYTIEVNGEPIRRVLWWCERRSVGRATRICAVSSYAGQRIRRAFRLIREDPKVIHNGVAVRRFSSITLRDENSVVFSGTLVRNKGVMSLAAAWREVVRKKPAAVLHIYGKDGNGRNGKRMSEEMVDIAGAEIARSIIFHGHVPWAELSAALDNARVAVFPSYSEAFSLAPLEAMAGGCPTIVTRRASGPEMIMDGRDGLLVDPDAPEEIAQALISVLDNDCIAESLGRGGYERVRRDFSLERIVPVNEDYYRQCIETFRE